MSDAPSHDEREHERPATASSAWMAWMLALLAVPLLYLLTLPPIFFLAMPRKLSYGVPQRPPTWLMIYTKPYLWVAEETPLGYPLNKYGAWWRAALE
ncbi:hypothetical protein [Roseimicrobium sp. ORNL1]|uniref:hypothetical protein n=1 Tax=Roseimicrobium sp. ORNL1 TaxID=2711231 RepID=UPI0013E1F8A6|nr:hypothetical protein [Roseimicrobium sp. ORNL1]QIF02091.1 hypothetical protein G5S37_11290 [Roseimicrobium sp. ORNL1]